MPQVKWPGGRKRLVPRWVWLVSVVGIVAIVLQILPLMQSQNVALAASQLPDPTLDSNNMSLVISQSTDTTVIHAPQDYVKIYLDPNATGTRSINIWNMPFDACNQDDTRPDWYGPTWTGCSGISTAANRTVMYDFFAMDANEDAPQPNPFAAMTLLFSVNGQNGAISTGGTVPGGAPSGRWSGNINLPVAGTVVSNVTGYRVIVMRARYASTISATDCGDATNPCVQRLHSYQIRVSNPADQLGYWEAAPGSPPRDGQYIIHYLGGECSTVPADCNSMVDHAEFRFAPSCLTTTDQPATLKWYDADASPTEPIYFVFYEEDQNGNIQKTTTINNTSSPDIGANNAYRELNFTAHPGWKYRWVWHNLIKPFGTGPNYGAANNVQMWLPFDSINYGLSCWNYHSTVESADGRANGATLDFSNPANQTVKFWVDARNAGSRTGPLAHTTPTMSPGGWATLVTSDPTDPQVNNGDINTALTGGQVLTHGAKYEFKFDPLTPTGQYCFGDTIAPHTSTDPIAPSDNTICYTVKNDRRFPSVVGLNSDVHAGGGLCPTDQNPGNVLGNNGTGGVSYGQYVVSAAPVGAVGGQINNFGSGGSPTTNKLNIGSSGNYQQICRKDLFTYAEQNKNLGDPNQHQLSAGTYTINPSWSGIYYASGPITLSSNPGGVSHRITIVMESGDLSISGDITLNGGFGASRPDAAAGAEGPASLGIITGGPSQSVFVEPAVRTVNAYIFSDGTVDTCATATVFAPPGCGNKLTINGFIMAKNINFKRTGPDGTLGPQIAEQLELTPQLYLNPPFYFDAGVDNNPLNGLGEKQPLF